MTTTTIYKALKYGDYEIGILETADGYTTKITSRYGKVTESGTYRLPNEAEAGAKRSVDILYKKARKQGRRRGR